MLYDKIKRMNTGLISPPNDLDALKELVMRQQKELILKDAKLDHQSTYINQLIEAIQLAKHQHFGARSEKFNSDQLSLLFNEAEVFADQRSNNTSSDNSESNPTGKTKVNSHDRRKGGRKPLPDHFPRVEVIHTLDEGECQCNHCHSQLHIIGEKASEQLDIVPATIRVIRHIRKTYGCANCKQSIKSARLPAQLIPGSIATPGTVSHIVVGKYVDGLPLYRQEQGMKRMGIELPRSTLANWMIKAGLLVQPLINLLRDQLLSYDIINMDETRCQVLKEPGKTPQSQSFMWVQRGGPPDTPIILFAYDPSRSQQVPVRLLPDYNGYLQTDGYDGYNKVCSQNDITQLGCWAHARRKFDEALKSQGKLKTKKVSLAAVGLKRIQCLYAVERQAKALTPVQRYELRQSRSMPILNDLRKWLDQHLLVVVKQSALGKAIHYLDKQWDKLIIYTEDGRLRMDNNLIENAIRPFVIGRKNHLFSDTVSGAKASANLYSLIETAKANGLEPYQYLKTVFTELPKATCVEDIEVLLPAKPEAELDEAA